METWGQNLLGRARAVVEWAEAAMVPLPSGFENGKEALEDVLGLGNPVHRVNEILARGEDLERGAMRSRRVRTVPEWEAVLRDLDAAVRPLLRDFDVELE